MGGWMNVWLVGWMDGCMDERALAQVCICQSQRPMQVQWHLRQDYSRFQWSLETLSLNGYNHGCRQPFVRKTGRWILHDICEAASRLVKRLRALMAFFGVEAVHVQCDSISKLEQVREQLSEAISLLKKSKDHVLLADKDKLDDALKLVKDSTAEALKLVTELSEQNTCAPKRVYLASWALSDID